MLIIKILIIGALLSLLDEIKPFWCAFIYTSIFVIVTVLSGMPIMDIMIIGSIKFVLAVIYFWLLHQAVEGVLWWVIAIIGFVLLV